MRLDPDLPDLLGLRDGGQPGLRHLRSISSGSRACGRPFWIARFGNGRDNTPVADAEVPGNGDPEDRGGDGRAVFGGLAPVGGQLCPSFRVHIWFPALVCPSALCHIWTIRAETEDCPALDLLLERDLPVYRPPAPILRHAHSRLRGLQVLQLHPHHEGLLRRPEHRLERRVIKR